MPGYVSKTLKKFQHKPPHEPQHAPFPIKPTTYGAKQQFVIQASTAPPLDKEWQEVYPTSMWKIHFLGQVVNSTLLCPISAIASQLAQPTQDTMNHILQLLDYLATQEDAILTYHASDMILAAHSDKHYLSEPKACSQGGSHFFLSSNADIPPNNGAILNIAHIIKHVMASATETKLTALFITAQEVVFIQIILQELGHAQPATPLQTNNTMADAVINSKI